VAKLDKFYISDDARFTNKLNYTYDDVVKNPWDGFGPGPVRGPIPVPGPFPGPVPGPRPGHGADNGSDYIQVPGSEPSTGDLAKRINNLYGSRKPRGAQQAELLSAMSLQDGQVDPVISIVYNRYALGGVPYTVYFFLGPIEANVPYKEQKSLVGRMHTFSAPVQKSDGCSSCSNCKRQADSGTLSCAQIPIQRAAALETVNNDRTAVHSHLKDNLRWVATFASGSKIPSKSLADLKISLLLGESTPPPTMDLWTRFDNFAEAEWDWKKSEL